MTIASSNHIARLVRQGSKLFICLLEHKIVFKRYLVDDMSTSDSEDELIIGFADNYQVSDIKSFENS